MTVWSASLASPLSDGTSPMAVAPAPLLVVMWRGNRVVVHGGAPMRTTARRPAMGIIAGCISDAESVPAMVTAFGPRRSARPMTSRRPSRTTVLVIRLVERPGADAS